MAQRLLQFRERIKLEKKNDIPCLQVVYDYNRYMGGVDYAYRLRAVYGVNRKSKKWWHRIFWGVLDIMFVNAFVVYKERHETIPLLEFRRLVVQGLFAQKEVPTPSRQYLFQKRQIPEEKKESKKGRGKQYTVLKDVRLTNRGIHWPKFVGSRGRCEVCSLTYQMQSRPYSKCTTCNVFLCCNDKKNCFAEYHVIDCDK